MSRKVGARVVLAGNNLAACQVLDLLLEALPADAVLVVAPPGGAKHTWQRSLAEYARELRVPHIEPTDVNAPEVVERVRDHGARLLLSVYYTQIFKAELLDAVGGPVLNFHPSLLPRHRGQAPLIWAIADGDPTTGVSVHHVDASVDTGRLVWQRPLPIHADDTGYELHHKAAAMVRAAAADLLRGWLRTGELPEAWEQSGSVSNHTSSDPTINHLDFTQDRARVRDVVRALAPPMPGAFCQARGKRIVLSRLEPVAGVGGDSLSRPPGMVEYAPGDVPLVWCADGPLRIDSFELEDGDTRRGSELRELCGVEEGELLA